MYVEVYPSTPATALRAGSDHPLSGPWFVLALAGVRRLAVEIKAIGQGDLLTMKGLVALLLVFWGLEFCCERRPPPPRF